MSSRETLDLAIVTSCHNYGKYLEDWAKSIVGLDGYLPRVCAIVDNGSTDTSPRMIQKAVAILKKAGIECRTERMSYANFGAGRNRAVELSGDTEWVMHLDADDALMAHALQDFVELKDNADVVGFGYQRFGDLQSGPKNRTRTYRTHRGEQTLKSTAPCSGVSPFRRRFWLKSPYREDMRGGWDTSLWIGFAHLNARFVPTRRPVFFYRQHADSVFNTRRISERKGKLVGVKLNNLRKKHLSDGVSVVVPIRSDDGPRDKAWEWVRDRYREMHPDWEVVEGRVPSTGVWKKGEAIMRGLEQASHHTLIVADADCIVAPDALERGVTRLREEGVGWVVPHELVHRLDQPTTQGVLRQVPSAVHLNGNVGYQRKPYMGYAGGGMFIVDRSDYEAVGGIPLIFQGWGAEDECLALILDTILEGQDRLPYDLWHLWHPTLRTQNAQQNKMNRKLLRIFLCYAGDPDGMWDLARFAAEGGDPRAFLSSTRNKSNTVLMMAVETHHRGKEVIQKGDYFRATDEEVRRHAARARKIARPVNGSLLSTVATIKNRR